MKYEIKRGEDSTGIQGWLVVGEDVGVFRSQRDARQYVRNVLHDEPELVASEGEAKPHE